MKKILLIMVSLLYASITFSQTTLTAGDIAIIQYNADGNPEVIKFLAFRSMESGTTINFTDNGWGGASFRTTEGVHTWTAGSSISCGDVVTVSIPNGGFNLNANGDQIFAYQGTLASPSFIFGINVSTGDWVDGSPASRKTALPSALTDGTNAVTLTHIDNTKYTGSLTGSKTTILSNICTPGNWTGSNSVVQNFTGTFTSNLTWSGSGTADDYFNVTIDASYDTASNGNFSTCNCTVNVGNTLTIGSSGSITVEEDIINNGTISVASSGSVVQVLSTGTNSGTDYTVNRTSTSQLEEGNYTYWSSPLASSTLADVANAKKYYSFTASSQSWIEVSSGTAMSLGKGYANTGESTTTYPNSYTASFSGSAFNNGNVNTSISLGTAIFVGADDDWNLLGNPYPSAIDSELFTADNSNLNGTIYYWTHATADSTGDNIQADYAMYNTSGGTGGASRYIASGQGFFVQANAGGTVTFSNAMRVTGNNSVFYKGKTKKKQIEDKDRVWLSLNTNTTKNQILVGFFDKATNGVDRLYDGLKLDSGSKSNFYSLIDEKPYGIQGLSLLKRKTIVPLGFSSTISGTFKISIDKKEGKLSASKIILFDKLLNVEHILDESDYEFTSDVVGTYNERFELIVKPKKVKLNGNSKKIKTYRKGNRLFVESLSDDVKLKRIRIYSLNGRLFYNEIVNDFETVVKLNKLKKRRGIYVLKVRLSSGEIVIKKMIL